MRSGLTLGPSLVTFSHRSLSISYKIASCRDVLFMCSKTFGPDNLSIEFMISIIYIYVSVYILFIYVFFVSRN